MKVSIITAVYNAKESIQNTIESVISQTYRNIEYIIVDGGSTDGTLDVIDKYRSRVSKFISEPDNGIYDAFNKGINLSSGDIVAFLNADDIYADNTVVERVVEEFLSKEVDSVYGDLRYIDENGKIVREWKSGEFKQELLKKGWMPPHPTFFVKKRIYQLYLAEKMLKFVNNEVNGKLMGEISGEIISKYTPEEVAKQMIHAFKSLKM